MVVIDTNIIFSMLLLKHSDLRDKFFEKEVKYYAPNYVFVEIFEHKEKLLKHSQLSETELYELLHRILQRIKFISEATLSKKNKKKAHELCKEVDQDDTPFVALCLQLGEQSEIWSGDENLKAGLIKKGFNRFYTP